MHLDQSPLDKVESEVDNAVLLYINQKAPGDDPSREAMSWFQYFAVLEQIKLGKRRRFELHHPATHSEFIIYYEPPIRKSTTVPTDFEVHLTPGEETLSVECDILRGEFMGLRPTPSSTLSRIQARQPQILRRALEIRQEYGDPIQNVAELLGNMPGSQEDWEALIDEPYY